PSTATPDSAPAPHPLHTARPSAPPSRPGRSALLRGSGLPALPRFHFLPVSLVPVLRDIAPRMSPQSRPAVRPRGTPQGTRLGPESAAARIPAPPGPPTRRSPWSATQAG